MGGGWRNSIAECVQADANRGPRSHWAADIWKNIPMRKTATLATASGVLRGAQIGIQNADGEIRAHGLRRTHRHGFCNNVLQHFKFHKPSVELGKLALPLRKERF